MTSLVVYESMFGATRAVAEAVVEGLVEGLIGGSAVGPADGSVDAVEVGAFAAAGVLPEGTRLLVVGGPTHAFGMTRAGTRRDAETRYGPVISRTGVRELLDHLTLPDGLAVAAFGTKVRSPISGSAARGIGLRLRRLGGRLVLPAQDFYVTGEPPGTADVAQLAAARAWGARLAAAVR